MKNLLLLALLVHSVAFAGFVPFPITCSTDGTFVGRSAGAMGCYTPAGGGDVTSPGTAVVGNIALFDDIAGTTLSDSGVAGNNLCLLTGDQTVAGVKTFSSAPILSPLTASQAVVTDGSKALASLAYAQAATASALAQRDGSGNLNVVGLNASGLTASVPVVTNGSKDLASVSYATFTGSLSNMVGDSGAGGTKGLVPAPAAGDAAAGKFLKADGTWAVAGGSGVWGSITGTLSDQTDLQTALDAKFDVVGGIFTGYVATVNGAAATPALRLGDPLNLTGLYTTGIDVNMTCAGSQCWNLTVNQMGAPKLFYMNIAGTGGTHNVIQANSATDDLLITASVGGTTGNGGGIFLGGNNTDVVEFWSAGVNAGAVDSTQKWNFYTEVLGGGDNTQSGFLQKQVTATATTITAIQCGSTFVNSGAVQIELPEASTVIGCRLTFVTTNASNFDINPDNADQILVQTDAAGDAIRNATLGNSITIEAISASQWAPISVVGTWSDIN